MAAQRARLFEDDLDVSGFAPKAPAAGPPVAGPPARLDV